ncbi:chemotaxis protein CheA, partial [Paraclostridium tenue]|uniref:chemotaxis protein CheA n=1 Tax=Paraclostridium tenue TaxID=1737 RepID=UPI0031F7A3D5
FGVVNSIENMCSFIKTVPEDLMGECDDIIIKDGFILYVKTEEEKSVLEKPIKETMFLESFEIKEVTDKTELENIFGKVNLSTNNDNENDDVEVIDNTSKEELEVEEKAKEEIKEIKEEPKKEEIVKADTDKKIEKEVKKEKNTKKENNHTHNKNSYLTVNISKVDTLMNLVGEIVTTESMVEKQSQLENFDRDLFEKQARRLHQLTNELQDVVMSIRMVPISSTFTKMQRVVRDMSRKTGKSVDLKLIGEQTEVDKNILENISDPLMHMVRNSMDHGIETPEERKLTSKPEKATVTLEAKNTGGDVVIIIKDDGRGLDKESIVKKAIEKGITNKNIEDISDKEAYNFILAPGFSTKEAVSEYSGRGVGMDVVYTNIRKLRGSISIDSEKGKGTMIILRIPLTLAIVDGMKVKIGDEIYIIPALNIKEVFRHGAYEIVQ